MAAEEGFEPSQTESESVVLPLHNSAINSTLTIIAHAVRFVNSFFAIFDFLPENSVPERRKGLSESSSRVINSPGKAGGIVPFYRREKPVRGCRLTVSAYG